MTLIARVLGAVGFLMIGSGSLALAQTAERDEVEGVVRVVGSAVNTKTIITPGSEFKGPSLCRGADTRKIARLSGFTVKVSGEWELDKKGDRRCLKPTTYQVTKTTSGRDAVVGVLSQKGGGYVVTDDAGKVHSLSELPDGLKKLDGKKIIVDLAPMPNPALREAASKVVTYSEFP